MDTNDNSQFNINGHETEGVWTNDPDVIRLQEVLIRYGINHAREKIYNVWSDYSERCHYTSWIELEDFANGAVIFAVYWAYLNKLITHCDNKDIFVDIIDKVTARDHK